ncbi:MAG: hypothetical protein KGZ58_08050 [Ignavibacteriales bacterium]|nr:hypothetical protein [Ignavibacteriales bacterium]
MKNIIVTITLVFNSLLSAQENNIDNSMILEKKKSIQFNIVGGTSVSYKTMLSSSTAIRYSSDLSFSLSDNKGDHKNEYENSSYTSSFNSNYKDNSQYISVNLQYIYYSQSIVPIYFGAGPIISFQRSNSRSSSTSTNTNSNLSINNSSSESRTIGTGFLGLVGTECKIINTMGLFAEYRTTISYNWSKSNYDYENITNSLSNKYKSEGNNRYWNITLSNVRVGISYYF